MSLSIYKTAITRRGATSLPQSNSWFAAIWMRGNLFFVTWWLLSSFFNLYFYLNLYILVCELPHGHMAKKRRRVGFEVGINRETVHQNSRTKRNVHMRKFILECESWDFAGDCGTDFTQLNWTEWKSRTQASSLCCIYKLIFILIPSEWKRRGKYLFSVYLI